MLWFRSGGSTGMRFPHGRAADIPVLAAQFEPGRRPAARQWWSISPTLHIATVTTSQGRRNHSGGGWDGWRPGVAGDGVADGVEGVDAVLAGGGDVAADAEWTVPDLVDTRS